MSKLLLLLLESLGFLAIVTGVGMFSGPLGLIIFGLGVVGACEVRGGPKGDEQ